MSGGSRITAAQRAALATLAPVLGADVYLAGGVAVAAHVEHRESRDLDLFSPTDPTAIRPTLERIAGVTITGAAAATLYLKVGDVPVSILAYDYPLLGPPQRVPTLPVPIASVDDLACMKLSAIANRGLARDFWDLHALIEATQRPLADFVASFRRKYPTVDVGHVVRSLAYFGDARAQPFPAELSADKWAQIRRDFEQWVSSLVSADAVE